MKKRTIIFDDKMKCCGCGVCALVCPRQAIVMEVDLSGFLYPHFKQERCTSCGLCERACAFKKQQNNVPFAVYALSRKDTQRLIDSASGGVFAGIAEQWIDQGNIVCGVAMIQHNGTLTPCHTMVQTKEELGPLLGSKYVQSDLGTIYSDIKKLLDSGRKVLFSGTPCQIAGLKSWLKKDYSGLLTIDLVCHGVPSTAMFQNYLEVESKKMGHLIEDFRFRDKEEGWGLNAKLIYSEEDQEKCVCVPSNQSSYYELFLHGEIYRESCYYCPYASAHHPADLTIGDYWGIEQEHPLYLTPYGTLDQKKGISMLMVNTEKGAEAFEIYKDAFWYYPSTFECASKHNEQLIHPSFPGIHREKVFKLYQKKGYQAVDKWFWKKKNRANRRDWLLHHLHHDVPEPIRKIIKKCLRRM